MSYAKGENCLEDICVHRITYDFLSLEGLFLGVRFIS